MLKKHKETTPEEITFETVKIVGYIKKEKVKLLIDYGSTHNFIHYKLAKVLN